MKFPNDIYYTANHEWLRLLNDNTALVGITHFAQRELGDIVYVETKEIDTSLNQNDIFGTIEAVKTVSDLYIPIEGTIIEINQQLESQPELINTDTYGEGWIIKIKIETHPNLDHLLDAKAYKESINIE